MSSLSKPVLVLNKVWIPIRIVDVKRSLKLIFADKAFIVDPHDYAVYDWDKWASLNVKDEEEGIETTRQRIKIPEIIVLNHYDKTHRRGAKLTKRNIYIRDSYVCQYTGKKVSHKEADIDHIVPRSKGGKNTWDNMVVCTKEINRKKGDRNPEEAGLKLLKKPSKPNSHNLLIDPKMAIPNSWDKFIKWNK